MTQLARELGVNPKSLRAWRRCLGPPPAVRRTGQVEAELRAQRDILKNVEQPARSTHRYATVWPTADEFELDNQMLKAGTFRRSYLKLISLLQIAMTQPKRPSDFDLGSVIADIQALEAEVPQTLDQLVSLYYDVLLKKA